MQLDMRRLEKKFKIARKQFLRRARTVLELGLELVEKFEDKPSTSEGTIPMQADSTPPRAKKARKNFDKDMLKNGALASQAAVLGTNKIPRRTARHH